jgi:hypothetical protein
MRNTLVALCIVSTLFAATARADESPEQNARYTRRVGLGLMVGGTVSSAILMVVGAVGATRAGCNPNGSLFFSDCEIMQYMGLGFGALTGVVGATGAIVYAWGDHQLETLSVSLAGPGARLSVTF